jgi:hypothetical protein
MVETEWEAKKKDMINPTMEETSNIPPPTTTSWEIHQKGMVKVIPLGMGKGRSRRKRRRKRRMRKIIRSHQVRRKRQKRMT